jgi:hypothetical protein
MNNVTKLAFIHAISFYIFFKLIAIHILPVVL